MLRQARKVDVYRVVCGKFVKYLTPPEGEAVAREHFAEMLKNFPHSEPPPAESGAMFFRSGRTSPEDNEADDERYLEAETGRAPHNFLVMPGPEFSREEIGTIFVEPRHHEGGHKPITRTESRGKEGLHMDVALTTTSEQR
ncbi:unnamed protein product [Heligmosomoides polygyrus]|uniref:DUF4817 domain-containing protein n=1 Tax=Heligmosomoides polygyrus TaxID=6339 RepID=A0A183GI72_HELPZ|nr:unnamed protein product [Heligmosomoides polygyrus]